ncbi:MAG: magnesium transporter [Planctomycetales bacterium]|nr:magnesium transporter [Planctomycetales bacterium]
MEVDVADSHKELARRLESGELTSALEWLHAIPRHDWSLVLSRLSPDERGELLTAVDPELGAELLEELPDVHQISVIEDLAAPTAAAILDQLPSDLQGDLIGELDDDDAQRILGHMTPEDASTALTLSRYEDDEAGGLMITEMLRYAERQTVASVIDDLRVHAEEYRDFEIQYSYVVDQKGALVGVLRMRDLLLAPHGTTLDRLMIRDPLFVRAETSIEELGEIFDEHSYLGVPVVDAQQRPLGVVLRRAVDDAWAEQQDAALLKLQGIVGGEELRSMPLMTRSSRRLAWLSINIVLNLLAASIIAMFQETLSTVIALAVFLPIISDMSGCSGNQAVAVSMRELSLGLVRPTELLRVWLKEISVGLLNGIALGAMIGAVAWAWQGMPMLGVVVAIALALNTLVAVSIGGLVPLLLRRWNLDPAVASGPILTTITDMCGFFWVLGLATLFLDYLKPATG